MLRALSCSVVRHSLVQRLRCGEKEVHSRAKQWGEAWAEYQSLTWCLRRVEDGLQTSCLLRVSRRSAPSVG